MALITKTVEVRQIISVTVDEDKFSEQFMEEFRASFYPFFDLDDHIQHLAQLTARDIITEWPKDQFVEGYGPLTDMGISCAEQDECLETEIVKVGDAA
ncbi:hypothetical protein [Pararhodobacter sp.]|uniref:hypothetical protein n=1 Tax=Pararhodobacter sp. TaxID=2127056 RepID=UPI002AFE94ED|nr:hypothetical protein [Pararhodobacter sp.]